MIIASNLAPSIESQIGDILWEGRLQSCLALSKIEADVAASSMVGGPDIPLVLIRSSGFIGRIEIQVREHCGMSVKDCTLILVVDSHPDSTHTLRVDTPFPALEAYAKGLDLESMDSMEHSHVPWVVLLVKAASIWKDSVSELV